MRATIKVNAGCNYGMAEGTTIAPIKKKKNLGLNKNRVGY